jgi:hypothetical protein
MFSDRLAAIRILESGTMKFTLHCVGEGTVVEYGSMEEVWVYVRENGLCSEEIVDDELPPRRILNPKYEIHTIATDGELIAMSRTRLSDAAQDPENELGSLWGTGWQDT